MNTYQLKCAIVSDVDLQRSVLGVFSSDELSQVHLPPGMGVIANTDVAGLPGRHWVAFFCNRKNSLEVFDSFGYSEKELIVYFNKFMRNYAYIQSNEKRLQGDDTVVCGQYCLFYLMCRVRGFTMQQITDVFSEDYQLNDNFVYSFIDNRFHCCVNNVCNVVNQSCIKIKN